MNLLPSQPFTRHPTRPCAWSAPLALGGNVGGHLPGALPQAGMERAVGPELNLILKSELRIQSKRRSWGAHASGVLWLASRQPVVPLTFSLLTHRPKSEPPPKGVNPERDFGGTPKSTRATRVLPVSTTESAIHPTSKTDPHEIYRNTTGARRLRRFSVQRPAPFIRTQPSVRRSGVNAARRSTSSAARIPTAPILFDP